MNPIELGSVTIDRALRRVLDGLEKYMWIQRELPIRNVSRDRDFQTTFNGFYRVRRNVDWQRTFFRLLEQGKTTQPSLEEVLRTLHSETGRVEASFATKLIASLDPSQPVIDSVVLRNLGARLPPTRDVSARLEGIVQLHGQLAQTFTAYLRTEDGRLLVTRFREVYPAARVSKVKMLDLVLWQTRPRLDRGVRRKARPRVLSRRG